MGSNCHTVCARDLTITWANDCRYWRWCCDGGSYVAELIQVWWLEVKGSYDTRCLPCGNSSCECEVSFLVKLKHNACGWNLPVKIAVCLPNGTRKEICVNLSCRPKEQWFEISAGRFSTCPGVINFSLCQLDGCAKTGLVIKEKHAAKEQRAAEESNAAARETDVAKGKIAAKGERATKQLDAAEDRNVAAKEEIVVKDGKKAFIGKERKKRIACV
ncbi:hypothetical protein TIFTF001_023717 [Ficus carica]|uniref:Uncharacterized protein n=1 Tax=Ficus carica TaxID=3494 RepID=A0AA88ANY5_FICCA|nr:hypothetical protein TIFTF001_023717 [Ficus carica]